jgi:antitoxin VapB
MAESGVAKLFRNGRSQAVRLPREFRFEGSEVNIRRDPASGNVILSPRYESCQEWYARLDQLRTDDFMMDRRDTPPQKRKKLF